MRTVTSIPEVRPIVSSAKQRGQRVGLVPTMGALHAGHLSLIQTARAQDDFVAVSVFINPTQFGPNEDYEAYPRQLKRDAQAAEQAGADLIFAPSAEEIYPPGFVTHVEVQRLTEGLCGRYRPGHFCGVCTVVTKLLNIVQPDVAYFGDKDYQQLVVIKRMVKDLNMPIKIVGVPTAREPNGLAVSSRNRYLSDREREVAPHLYQALQAGAALVRQGATGTEAAQRVEQLLAEEPLLGVQYVEAVDPEALQPTEYGGPPMVIAAAVYLGETRLIDNIAVEEGSDDAQIDG